MESQLVFRDEKEINRLQIQEKVFIRYERPVFCQLFEGRSGLRVLDIGCNDGEKTVRRFDSDAVQTVIGLEYCEELAARAQKKYGGKKYHFYPCDAESDTFATEIKAYMSRNGIACFDIIYLSFVLNNIKNTSQLFLNLKKLLAPDGTVVILEVNDSNSYLTNDEQGLFRDFLEILEKDPFGGNRYAGKNLERMLEECGYSSPHVHHDRIVASVGNLEMKHDLLEIFFSYLPDDVKILRESDPGNEEYGRWNIWLENHFEQLHELVLQNDTELSIGICLMTCKGEVQEP